MRTHFLVSLGAALGAIAMPARAGDHAHEGVHSYREPQVVDDSSDAVVQLALESDEELSVLLYKPLAPGEPVRATLSDGRGVEWSSPTTISTSTRIKEIRRDSIQVVGDEAFAAWLEYDAAGPGLDRVVVETYRGGVWDPDGNGGLVVDVGYPAGSTVTAWRFLAKPGLNGSVYVYVLATVSAPGAPSQALLSVSAFQGALFRPAEPVSTAPPGAGVEGLGLDAQMGEIHVAWSDDRAAAGTHLPYYRRGVVDFFGALTWFEAERVIGIDAQDVAGDLQVAVNGGRVGVGFLQGGGASTKRFGVASSLDSGMTLSGTQVLAGGGGDVLAFDLEISGDLFVACWEEVKPTGKHEIRRGLTETGVGFSSQPISGAGGTLDHDASDPTIARSVGVPDGTVIVWVETDLDGGTEVFTSFKDQAGGGEWHDEYPLVSEAEAAGAPAVLAPRAAYNHRYDNFLIAWLQDTPEAPGVPDVYVGGYRPPEVDVEGWIAGAPTNVSFHVDHLPFEDLFSFILLGDGPAGGPGLVLPDGRSTGLAFSPFLTMFSIQEFALFLGVNDPSSRGSSTTPIGPVLLPVGAPLSGVGISWGPYGELHVVTDPFEVVAEIPAP